MRDGASEGVKHWERPHDDYELSWAITRLRSQRGPGEPSGVLVTWHGPWSYTLELCHQIPPGLVYECIAPERLNRAI
ncbi:hypothetical protein J2S92_002864 [Arthrobacter bambusae]|nr:hypothetical protein [Arthrobacter bambusae]MDQ0236606.1 hypothetical protein [Arthrobacter bambusae]